MRTETETAYGGIYSETTAVRFLLERMGMPITEAMVFGISGGIGFSYFTMTYEGHPTTLYIGAGHRYKTKFGEIMTPFFERTGLKQTVKTATTPNAAEKNLFQALQQGQPVLVHTTLGFYCDHAVVVESYDEQNETFTVADLASEPRIVTREEMRQTRDSIKSLKNRMAVVEAPTEPLDLKQAVRLGIEACCDKLQNPPTPRNNFGLPGMRKWASLVNDPKNKMGWPKLFSTEEEWERAVREMSLWITTRQSGRGALRGLYADFLREAAALLEAPALTDVAARYDELERLWTELAQTTQPEELQARITAIADQEEAAIQALEQTMKSV